jgi:negative regulator of sigma E activity
MANPFPDEREKLWRRTGSEPDGTARPSQPELELEARLTEALARLPDTPVPSNFTARVMAAIDLEESRPAPARAWRWNWHVLLPRMAVATAILLFAGIGVERHLVSQRRAEMVRTLSLVANATKRAPSLEVFENLDAIERMGQTTHADTELLADLQ